MNRMAALEAQSEINLGPGDFYFGQAAGVVQTLLGSCVAITLWHPALRWGGMCHYLLPRRGANQRFSAGHFAEEAVSLFLEKISAIGTQPQDYEAKLFGGGNMFASLAAGPWNVAQQNIQIGKQLLTQHGFRLANADVGGESHRKVRLDLHNGEVWVQRGRGLGAAMVESP